MKKILILGATSAIAAATARIWAKDGHRLFLVARNGTRLDDLAQDLKARGAEATHPCIMDLTEGNRHGWVVAEADRVLGGIDIALIAYGTLPDQGACQVDAGLVVQVFNTNAVSVVSLLTYLANHFEAQRKGTLAVITSVAGERGRTSNYAYGSAKAAVSTFCEGVRARLHPLGVHVVDIRPGFVISPMTQGRPFPRRLAATPDQVAGAMVSGIDRGVAVLYLPQFWSLIMFIVRNLPSFLFRRLPL